MAEKYDKLENARNLIFGQSFGTFSTQSLSVPGYPFGSLVPYVVDSRGNLVILISDIAEHTKI